MQLVVLGSQLVDLAKSGGNVGERAGRIGAELGESPLLALEEKRPPSFGMSLLVLAQRV